MPKNWKIILFISLVLNLSIVYVAYKAYEYRSHINYFLDKYTNVVNEFSGRNYYKEANEKLRSQPDHGNRVVLFGTQIMERWHLTDTTGQFDIINRGLSHQRVAGFLLRFKPDVIDLNPKVVIIEISSYNFRPQHSVQEIMDYASSLAELARYNDVEPVLTTIIPLTSEVDTLGDYVIMDSLKIYNLWIRNYCDDNDIMLLDFNALLSGSNGYLREELSNGPIDLNEQAYDFLYNEVMNILSEVTDN